nr:hypothetical protein [Thiocapsa sp. KS1]
MTFVVPIEPGRSELTVSQPDTDASRHDATAPFAPDGAQVPSRLARIMRAISKRFPRDPSGENAMAVRLFRRAI